ncbi:MAG: CapA family protein [Bifidobacteriaceae bacterium]|jgi:poly-gamma-glutamate synthesis protein (capsule biosynthesis protein)|nr:CapA family protein [Bifidobacteriaceae bacterium]
MRPSPRLLVRLALSLLAGSGLFLGLVAAAGDWPGLPGLITLPDAAGATPPVGLRPPSVTVTVPRSLTAARTAPPAVPSELTVTVAFGGDLLTHQPVNQSAAARDGSYDFTPLLTGVDPWIAGADLAICQMEVPLAPPGVAPTGYPIFGAPSELVGDLAEQGWDGCTTASNHSLDKGWAGVSHTIETLRGDGLGYAGTALTEADSLLPQLYQLTGSDQTLTIAHIAATYGTNGLPLPSDQPWAVATPIETSRLVDQAVAARAAGADIVIASIHAGVEYQTQLSAEQKGIVARLAASGQIDAVIGDHPHVSQPIELVSGGVNNRGMWTIYSLGNFLSNQTDGVVGPNTDTGAVVYVTITKDPAGAAVTGMTWSGVTVDSTHGHRLYMLQDAAANGGDLGQIGSAGVTLRYDRLRAIMGSAPEQLSPPTPSGASLVVVPRQ